MLHCFLLNDVSWTFFLDIRLAIIYVRNTVVSSQFSSFEGLCLVFGLSGALVVQLLLGMPFVLPWSWRRISVIRALYCPEGRRRVFGPSGALGSSCPLGPTLSRCGGGAAPG